MTNRLCILGFLLLLPAISLAYLPADIERLNESDTCQSCDLTEYVIDTDDYAVFHATNLDHSSWTKATLEKVDFKKKSLVHANFVLSLMYAADFDAADLSYTNFSDSLCILCFFKGAKLMNSLFYEANMQGAQLTNADLSNANLEKADASYAGFMHVDFTGANLSGANLSKANLYGSNITQKQLDSLGFYQCAILPDGTVYDEKGAINCGE